MKNSKLEWEGEQYWTKPWNPVIGCRPISPACEHCYARDLVKRFNMTGVEGAKSFEPVFKEKLKNPPRSGVVFCGNMTDLFGEWVVYDEMIYFIGKTLGHIEKATYLWLTKRPDRMCEMLNKGRLFLSSDDDADFRFSDCEMCNQYFGFTAENQEWYDKRFNIWRSKFPSWANGWVSLEPLLGPIDLHLNTIEAGGKKFKWIVVGCESGPKRRPCETEWVRHVVAQCEEHRIPVFVKQLNIGGKCVTDIGRFPDDLKVRQVSWFCKEDI